MRLKIRNRIMMKLKLSGYKLEQRINIFLSGLRGYKRMEDREDTGIRKINRTRKEGATERRIQKMLGKTDWFRKKVNRDKKKEILKLGSGKVIKAPVIREVRKQKNKDDRPREIEAVLFVPYTRGGALQRKLQEVEDDFVAGTSKKKIKMVERGGVRLRDLLCQTDAWSKRRCERQTCLPCQSKEKDGGISCQKESITYRIKCMECGRQGKDAEYWGESARTGYKRGKEHLEGLVEENEDAPLWRHSVVFHEGAKNPEWYRMKVIRAHRTAMQRQIEEGVEIDHSKADILLNSKGEWNGSKLPKIVMETGKDINEDSFACGRRMM